MPTITSETISVAQIRTLRRAAESIGDHATVALCDLATAPHETTNADGSPLIGPCGGQTTRTEAREACAEAINLAAQS